MGHERNWAGNLVYGAAELHIPDTVEQVRELVARRERVKVLGTRHSFNDIADTCGSHLSLERLNRVIGLDENNGTVTVEAGIRYGELSEFLHGKGYALPNLASLPHISVAGACATATHGSGDRNGTLATAVRSLELVNAEGELVTFVRGQEDFDGAVVGLGGLGVVVRLTLDVVPTFEISQHVYEGLPLARLEKHLDDIFSGAYSVSLFTDWKAAAFNQVWLKRKVDDASAASLASEWFGATPADAPRHPVPGHEPEPCTGQMGVPGAWYERLPHFRPEFTPSAGDELQSEYFVPRRDAYDALHAISGLRERIAPLLHVSEVRTVAADGLWMSPCYERDSVGIHFTWKSDEEAVRRLLPEIEAKLAPFQARPHWGKLFVMPPDRLQPLYARLPDFRRLMRSCDPRGKFRNAFLERYIVANGLLPRDNS
ncbi:FAD-binding protein [Paenibacillus flagellatus]|uniref:FAD-binding protein n=1 Tax=Paenibacillus flagellatus TaxID=2211139 RepID=A0A2V5KAZ9_9BACL|nr:FAD-binding protein [Paenibacillus flagellatus]PYI51000.1 FAD-binding protein [Paenibacillus flagellatus]